MKKDELKTKTTHTDFLQREDRLFILWRLTRMPELDDYWQSYINEHPEEREAFDRAITVCDSITLGKREFPDTKQTYERILRSIAATGRRRASRVRLVRWAAAAAIALLLVIPTYYYIYTGRERGEADRLTSLTGQILQGESIVLTIGDDKIALPDSADVRISDGRIYCNGRSLGMPGGSAGGNIARLSVPAGKRSFLTLPDLSKVWVNSGTEVEFPVAYAASSRDIQVDGEIYIDVARNSQKPFLVHTEKLDVLVHGTSFNVSAYRQESEVFVVLVHGKVQVSMRDNHTAYMRPNQKATLKDGNLTLEEVDVNDYTSWKDGYLIFNKASMAEVLAKVGKYYNIDFSDQNSNLSRRLITGKLFLASDIDEILASISLLTSTTYTRNHNHVTFTEKRKETRP